jgi:hypothetical protein
MGTHEPNQTESSTVCGRGYHDGVVKLNHEALEDVREKNAILRNTNALRSVYIGVAAADDNCLPASPPSEPLLGLLPACEPHVRVSTPSHQPFRPSRNAAAKLNPSWPGPECGAARHAFDASGSCGL